MILKSEQKLEEMVQIMDHLQQYVPTLTSTKDYLLSGSDIPVSVTLDEFHHTLIGKVPYFQDCALLQCVFDTPFRAHCKA